MNMKKIKLSQELTAVPVFAAVYSTNLNCRDLCKFGVDTMHAHCLHITNNMTIVQMNGFEFITMPNGRNPSNGG